MPTLVINGHPHADALCAHLAKTYVAAHGDARLLALRNLAFDPSLRFGYSKRMELEPDLIDAWNAILEAEHIVVVAPVWWGSAPALLKGFFDRLLLPKRAYQYGANGLPQGLLSGRTGRLIMTSDSPFWYLALTRNPAARSVRNLTMRFCGIRTPRATMLGPVRHSTAEQRAGWVARVEALAKRDATASRRQPVPAH
ncbi:flavodoxin family protein [Salinibacterium sp. dk2585]|uniref:NAD(P)H-dependent oxidoreductase n=1 Tax=unclassified Salinibacterium TaxID=2632331 RepID=UPI0011C24DAC|nr:MULTISPECIES: NAD(P)H-dependent oxidoreductase [unclassified Salinibacterium]QEE60209.1 flavodoxin family protein [Salinibacterium sp. dk2585]TXK55281.1 flavodoxin family protein [Salinibacterium sp. dk5596]